MSKASSSSEWENIQGFDRTKGEYYIDLPLNHHIREEGKKRGSVTARLRRKTAR